MKRIKALGFDYGGVIGGGPRVGKKFTAEICELLRIDQTVYREIYFSMNHLINTGKVGTWRKFWPLFLDRLHLPAGQIDPIMKLSQKYAQVYIEMDQQIIDLIDRPHSLGYKTGLLSNATKENGVQMRGAGLDKHFDTFLISAEIGIQKPNPQAFNRLAEELGIPISDLAFIDDSTTSLEIAGTLGFTPILFQSYPQLINGLTNLKIL